MAKGGYKTKIGPTGSYEASDIALYDRYRSQRAALRPRQCFLRHRCPTADSSVDSPVTPTPLDINLRQAECWVESGPPAMTATGCLGCGGMPASIDAAHPRPPYQR